ncbi:MAG: hypothetical protein CL607_13120 [Anaerolineaceae bacterium]|nr:hypothetical protein [Anaerolineaceae bacterium]
MQLADIHSILFNMVILYSFLLGVYAAVLAARNGSISGNFWGAIGVYVVLTSITLIVGVILILSGYTVESGGRIIIYILYMLFMIVIMPGLFSFLQGRDDRSAAMYFAMLALFNAAVALSMAERGLTTWILTTAS